MKPRSAYYELVRNHPPVVLDDRVVRALEEAAADFRVTYNSGQVVRYGVMNFPDASRFAAALRAEGLIASYSAGSGWDFYEAPASQDNDGRQEAGDALR